MKAVLHYRATPGFLAAISAIENDWLRIAVVDETDTQALAREIQEADVLLHVLERVTASTIEQAPRLKLIQKLGVGVDTIDLHAARGRGIAVCNMPGANTRAVAELDPTLPISQMRTMNDVMWEAVARPRFLTFLLSSFAGLALLLAGLGLYGVVAHAVSARRREIGLRMALGALPAGVVRLVFRRVGVLIVAGLALGLAGSWWAARFVAPLLFKVESRDPTTFAGTAAVLVAVGVLAAWVPARRAARLDPATARREG